MPPAMAEIVDLKILRAHRHSHHLVLSLRHGRACPGHPRLAAARKTWMPAPSAGMTQHLASSPRLDPIAAGRIENRDQPDHARVALVPFPGEALEGAALARYLIEIGADILDGRNAGSEQRFVRGVPFRKIVDRLAAGRLLVFGQEMLDLRPVAVRAERRRQRMVDGRGIDANGL